MLPTATELDPELVSNHGPDTRFFASSDGKWFIIKADLDDYSHLRDSIVRQPTVILYTDETGHLADLDVDFEFEPGTTHEDAVAGAGYELVVE